MLGVATGGSRGAVRRQPAAREAASGTTLRRKTSWRNGRVIILLIGVTRDLLFRVTRDLQSRVTRDDGVAIVQDLRQSGNVTKLRLKPTSDERLSEASL